MSKVLAENFTNIDPYQNNTKRRLGTVELTEKSKNVVNDAVFKEHEGLFTTVKRLFIDPTHGECFVYDFAYKFKIIIAFITMIFSIVLAIVEFTEPVEYTESTKQFIKYFKIILGAANAWCILSYVSKQNTTIWPENIFSSSKKE